MLPPGRGRASFECRGLPLNGRLWSDSSGGSTEVSAVTDGRTVSSGTQVFNNHTRERGRERDQGSGQWPRIIDLAETCLCLCSLLYTRYANAAAGAAVFYCIQNSSTG